MRRRVEELVSQFVDKTWEGVRANVSCNGVDMAPTQSSGDQEKADTEGRSCATTIFRAKNAYTDWV